MERLRSRGYIVKEGPDIPIAQTFESPSWVSEDQKVFDQYLQPVLERATEDHSSAADAILVYALSSSLDGLGRGARRRPPGNKSTDKLVVGENSRYWLYSLETQKTVLSNHAGVKQSHRESESIWNWRLHGPRIPVAFHGKQCRKWAHEALISSYTICRMRSKSISCAWRRGASPNEAHVRGFPG